MKGISRMEYLEYIALMLEIIIVVIIGIILGLIMRNRNEKWNDVNK